MTHSDGGSAAGRVSYIAGQQNRPESPAEVRDMAPARRHPKGRPVTDSDTTVELPQIILAGRSDIAGVPAEAWLTHEIWCPIPGYRYYQASSRGRIRSIDRIILGTRYKSVTLKPRLNNSGYPIVNLTGDDGKPHTDDVHSLEMLAFAGRCPPGQQVRHFNDVSDDNRWAPGGEDACGPGKPGNLLYGDGLDQRRDQDRNRPRPPREPKPPKFCVTLGHEDVQTIKGRQRCEACITQTGVDGARLLAAGLSAEAAAAQLGYASAEGLAKLAVTRGGWDGTVTPAGTKTRWSRRVTATVRRWLGRPGGDAK